MTEITRACPLCDGTGRDLAFPFQIQYRGQIFAHVRCSRCATVFVDPLPDDDTFRQIYTPEAYHDLYYNSSTDTAPYAQSVRLLSRFAPLGARVLDYGCGGGHFLLACRELGFIPIGLEFDAEAADAASRLVGVPVQTIRDWHASPIQASVDVIHMGDVLEHLPAPADTLSALLLSLKPSGLLFVEGPLEDNASLVLWVARCFGWLKLSVLLGRVGEGVPAHLFRTHATAQRSFFQRLLPGARELYWKVEETGWPYASGGLPKRLIAAAAQRLSGLRFMGRVMGNRFQIILQVP